MKHYGIFTAALLAATFFCMPHAQAQTFKPALSGEILFELENDWAHDSDDNDAEVNTLYTTVEPSVTLSLTDELSIQAALVFEPVQATDAGDDTAFDNEGLYAEELKFVYETAQYSLYAGKFDPNFGTAWDVTPGLYGVDFAEGYQLVEKLGVGGSYTIGEEPIGEYTFGVSSFFADTTVLSDSTITRRERLHKSDGGMSNTENFSSFALSVDGESVAGIDSLNTHIGYYNQAEGDADTGLNREKGYALGASYALPLTEDFEVGINGEWAGIRDSAGSNDDVDYITGGVGVTLYDHWNIDLSGTHKKTSVVGGADTKDHMTQLSGGYTFDNGISATLGYKKSRESDVDTGTVGGLLSYTVNF